MTTCAGAAYWARKRPRSSPQEATEAIGRRSNHMHGTTARPRKGTTRSRGRRGSGSTRGEEYEGSLVRLRCEAAVAAGHGQRWE